jgi:CubicO group peptidase (beta-lactamase class C family)
MRRVAPFIAVLSCVSAGAAQTSDHLPELVEPLLRQQLQTRDIAGAVVSIVRSGAPAYVRAFGIGDVAAARPMTTDTRLRLASISKVFTTVAVLQLVDQGRLNLDRDVNAYVSFPIPPGIDGRPVTLRRILTIRTASKTRSSASPTWQARGSRLPTICHVTFRNGFVTRGVLRTPPTLLQSPRRSWSACLVARSRNTWSISCSNRCT